MKKIIFLALFSLMIGSVGTFAVTPKKVVVNEAKTEVVAKDKKVAKVSVHSIKHKHHKVHEKNVLPKGN
jgi:hypothetical protein